MNFNWELFFNSKTKKIFLEKKEIVDIGGGLRIDKNKNNKYRKDREWIREMSEKVDYKIMDVVPDYNPDVVGDIHKMPFNDNSIDAIFCLAVLEHVEDPIRACQEIYRVLKEGGYCLVYIPFLYYYHAYKGYYKDYWRFTSDSIDYIFRDFKVIEKQPIRGPLETWIFISPLGRIKFLARLFGKIDRVFYKNKNSNQVSGYYVFLTK